ncbi:serine/threonine-protein kinase TIO-like [Phragmites australis]|uniref:serine/threonine-protein kinase TIO-like n=1 Tax=Phragmites australis TaxID=29695 RepID=UPI002D772968|nr:serine/threonine-protein kinase TIO-like [Phragmites australis]
MGIEDYHVTELVGEGSFGKVYKGRRKYTRQTVAMKFILKPGKTDKDIHNLRQEIEGSIRRCRESLGFINLSCPVAFNV